MFFIFKGNFSPIMNWLAGQSSDTLFIVIFQSFLVSFKVCMWLFSQTVTFCSFCFVVPGVNTISFDFASGPLI